MIVIINCKYTNAESSFTYYEVERLEVKTKEVTIKQKDDVPHILDIPTKCVMHIVVNNKK